MIDYARCAVLQAEYEIPVAIILDFIDALIADQWPRHLQTQDQLIQVLLRRSVYSWLDDVSPIWREESTRLSFAVDLGVAMQMTNICRDILEDAERQRIYLPAEMLPVGVNAHGLVKGDAEQRDHAYRAAVRLLGIANEYYASASQGYGYLPTAVRQAIRVAARLYQAIGEKIVAQPAGIGGGAPWSRQR